MARRPAKAAVVIMCLWVRVLGQLGCGLRKLQGPAETLRSLLALHLFHALWKKMLTQPQHDHLLQITTRIHARTLASSYCHEGCDEATMPVLELT